MISSHSRSVSSHSQPASDKDPNHSLIKIISWFGCFCCINHPTKKLNTSVLHLMIPVLFDNARTFGDISATSCEFLNFNFSSSKCLKISGWTFCRFVLKSAARRLTLATNLQKTLHNSKNVQISITFFYSFNNFIASVVCNVIGRPRKQTSCSK